MVDLCDRCGAPAAFLYAQSPADLYFCEHHARSCGLLEDEHIDKLFRVGDRGANLH